MRLVWISEVHVQPAPPSGGGRFTLLSRTDVLRRKQRPAAVMPVVKIVALLGPPLFVPVSAAHRRVRSGNRMDRRRLLPIMGHPRTGGVCRDLSQRPADDQAARREAGGPGRRKGEGKPRPGAVRREPPDDCALRLCGAGAGRGRHGPEARCRECLGTGHDGRTTGDRRIDDLVQGNAAPGRHRPIRRRREQRPVSQRANVAPRPPFSVCAACNRFHRPFRAAIPVSATLPAMARRRSSGGYERGSS